jgi:fructosamine-3-kinase
VASYQQFVTRFGIPKAEIELRNELPGGEIHAAWHLRYAGEITS